MLCIGPLFLGWRDGLSAPILLPPTIITITPPPTPNFDAIDLGNGMRGTIDFLLLRLPPDPIYRPAVPVRGGGRGSGGAVVGGWGGFGGGRTTVPPLPIGGRRGVGNTTTTDHHRHGPYPAPPSIG